MKTRELETDRWVSLPSRPPPFVQSPPFLHCASNQTYSRLNVPTKCTPVEISLPPVSSSTLNSGARQLHGSWPTLSMTSATSIGVPFLACLTSPQHEQSRKRPSAIAFQWMWTNMCRSLFPTLPLPFVTIDHPCSSVPNVHLLTSSYLNTPSHPSYLSLVLP